MTFPSGPSPRTAELFRLLVLHPGPDFSLHAAAALTGLPDSRTRQELDGLAAVRLLEQTAPGRYRFRDERTDYARQERPPEQWEPALLRLLDWYLHTADAAQSWISPTEKHLPLTAPAAGVRPLSFADYDAAVDWAERDHGHLFHLVRAAMVAGLSMCAWQLAALSWAVTPPAASQGDWLPTGRLGLEAAEGTGDENAQALLLDRLGMNYRGSNLWEESLGCHRRALALSQGTGHRDDEARSLILIGLIHLRRRQLDSAAQHFEWAATIYRELDDSLGAAAALSNLTSTLVHAGRLTEGLAAAEEALAAHRAAGNKDGVGDVLRIAAEVLREQGDIPGARRAIDEALDIALALRNRRVEGFWLIILGNVQQDAGEYGDALASYQRSAMLHRRLGDRSREALAWRGAGETYVRMGRHEEAVGFHRQAEAVHRELGDTWNRAVELDRLAVALLPGDPGAARGHWVEALGLLEGYDDPRAMATRDRVQERLSGREG